MDDEAPRFGYFFPTAATGEPIWLVIDPVGALPRLIAILQGKSTAESAIPVVNLRDEGIVELTPTTVLTLNGADGDPELEWDDVLTQWRNHPDSESLADLSDQDLMDALSELRAIASKG